MRHVDFERVINSSKEYRRYKIRGLLVLFGAMLFTTVAFFVMVGITDAASLKENANGSSDEFQDIRYTVVDGKEEKEYLSEEEIAAQDKRIEEEKKRIEEEKKKEEEAKKKAEEEKKLDILKKYNVKATFFVTCNRAANRQFIKRAHEEGHSIGLHTCSHDYAKVYASEEAYFKDLESISNLVKELTGTETKLIRFPGGSSNTVSKTYSKGLMSKLAKAVQEKGYVYFDWNVSSGDAGGANTSGMVYNNITKSLRGDYSIVLQHDIKGFSVDAVEGVIKFGKQYGFEFKALDMNSPTAHHRINN